MPRSNSSLPPAVGIGGNSCRQCSFSMSVSGIGGSASSTVTLTGARRTGRSCRPTRGARRARQRRKAGVWSRPRVCENGQEPTSWRIVFSIALFPIAATALFLLRLAKSRRIFYAQTECLCFRTGWPLNRHWPPPEPSNRENAPFNSRRQTDWLAPSAFPAP